MISGGKLGILATFTEGLLSFLSPCVLPLIPLYISYLTADARSENEEGETVYQQGKVLLITVSFILGISLTFVLLGLTVSKLGVFLEKYSEIFGLCGAFILIVFALFQLEVIRIPLFERTARLSLDPAKSMTAFRAFAMGFLFSFAWTPCIGPMLSSVLILMASEPANGYLYLLFYACGFLLPFLLLGIFTRFGLNLIGRHKDIVKYTVKLAAVILLCFGLYLGYQNTQKIVTMKNELEQIHNNSSSAFSFSETELKDHLGETHRLADYKGDLVFLNFTATWCGYCKQEIPYYLDFLKKNDLTGFFIMNNNVNGVPESAIAQYAEDNGIDIPILIDADNRFFSYFRIEGYPTLFVIDTSGEIMGYVSGMLDEAGFEQLLENIRSQ